MSVHYPSNDVKWVHQLIRGVADSGGKHWNQVNLQVKHRKHHGIYRKTAKRRWNSELVLAHARRSVELARYLQEIFTGKQRKSNGIYSTTANI